MPYRDPEKAKRYQAEYRRGRRQEDGCKPECTSQSIPADLKLKTAADVLDLLADAARQVMALDEKTPAKTLSKTLAKARTLGYLAGLLLRAVDAADVSARLAALEARLAADEHKEPTPRD